MKFSQLVVGKSYTNGKGSIRTYREKASGNVIFYLEDERHLVFNCPGQEFAAWARYECPTPPSHLPRRR